MAAYPHLSTESKSFPSNRFPSMQFSSNNLLSRLADHPLSISTVCRNATSLKKKNITDGSTKDFRLFQMC